jgi:hypothetical protein
VRDLVGHAEKLATYLARTGADLMHRRLEYRDKRTRAQLVLDAELPGAGLPPVSRAIVRESYELRDDAWELVAYRYELLDREMDGRRAFHLHDTDAFLRKYFVLVHEHCERPIGTSTCDHFAGLPIRDSREGIQRILAAWTDGFECRDLTCLEPR